jgi:hypothetical protein
MKITENSFLRKIKDIGGSNWLLELKEIIKDVAESFKNDSGESLLNNDKKINASFLPELSESVVEITKAQLDTLVTNESLIPGQLYKISGVDTALYGGTDILMTAATTSELSLSGHGIFYNPKYLNSITTPTPTPGFGVYNNYIFYTVTSQINTFVNGDIVTANNGATAIWRGFNVLELLTGDWTGVTSMVSTTKSAVIVVTDIPSSYSIGDNVIWGGKHWINKTGNIGTVTDTFTLDSTNWEVVPFNDVDYNVTVDEISYDYENDLIIARKDLWGNDVNFSKEIFTHLSYYLEGFSPIKLYQWGNYPTEISNSNRDTPGVYQNKCNNGVVECINFRGLRLNGNILNDNSTITNIISNTYLKIYGNTFNNFSAIDICTFRGAVSINENNFTQQAGLFNLSLHATNSSYAVAIYNNTFTDYSSIGNSRTIGSINYLEFWGNNFFYGIIRDCFFIEGGINLNTLEYGAEFRFCTFTATNIYENSIKTCNIQNTNFNNLDMTNNRFDRCELVISGTFSSKDIRYVTAAYSSIIADLTSAIIIFGSYPKQIFRNSSGTTRLSYYNASDVLTVVNINA